MTNGPTPEDKAKKGTGEPAQDNFATASLGSGKITTAQLNDMLLKLGSNLHDESGPARIFLIRNARTIIPLLIHTSVEIRKKSLADEDPNLRRQKLQAIDDCFQILGDDEQAGEILARLLPNKQKNAEPTQASQFDGCTHSEVVAQFLLDTEAAVRKFALYLLANRLGYMDIELPTKAAVTQVFDFFSGTQEASYLVRLTSRFAGQSLVALADVVQSPEPRIQITAARAISQLASQRPDKIPIVLASSEVGITLERLCSAEDPKVRAAAISSHWISELEPRSLSSLFTTALRDQVWNVRTCAAQALSDRKSINGIELTAVQKCLDLNFAELLRTPEKDLADPNELSRTRIRFDSCISAGKRLGLILPTFEEQRIFKSRLDEIKQAQD